LGWKIEPVLRENSVPTDFVGFVVFWTPSSGTKILLMMAVVQSFNLVIFAWFNRVAGPRILVLRKQLTVYKRKLEKPMLRNRDRLFWSLPSRIWRDWISDLIIVRPETVIRWTERKFREFWRRKSQGRSGRPAIPNEHIDFTRRISSEHPDYGADRIALELGVKFHIRHASSTVRDREIPKPEETF
jgi:hypothetical protein